MVKCPMVNASVCPLCDDTGWKPVDENGVRRVARCDCWRDSVGRQRLDEARIPKRYLHCTLANFTAYNESLVRTVAHARRIADSFPQAQKGLFLEGQPGVGKTHLAVAVLKQVIQTAGARGLFYDTRDLLRVIRSTYDPSIRTTEIEVLRPVMHAELLVLDDLGAEKTSEWVDETMNLIVNTRYNERRLTIFTSNYPDIPDDTEPNALVFRIGHRMRSRLHEMCDFEVHGRRGLSRDADQRRRRRSAGDVEDASQDAAVAAGRPAGPRAAARTGRARRQSRLEVAGRSGGKLEPGSGIVDVAGRADRRGTDVHVRCSDDPPASRARHPAPCTLPVPSDAAPALHPLGLYLHIPFCAAICNYCNFNRSLFDGALKTRYVDALIAEMTRAGGAGGWGGERRRVRPAEQRPTRSTSAAARRRCWSRRRSAASSTPVWRRIRRLAEPRSDARGESRDGHRRAAGRLPRGRRQPHQLRRAVVSRRGTDAVVAPARRRAGARRLPRGAARRLRQCQPRSDDVAPGAARRRLALFDRRGHRARSRAPVVVPARAVPERAAQRRDGARAVVAGARRRRRGDVSRRPWSGSRPPAITSTRFRTSRDRAASRGTTSSTGATGSGWRSGAARIPRATACAGRMSRRPTSTSIGSPAASRSPPTSIACRPTSAWAMRCSRGCD